MEKNYVEMGLMVVFDVSYAIIAKKVLELISKEEKNEKKEWNPYECQIIMKEVNILKSLHFFFQVIKVLADKFLFFFQEVKAWVYMVIIATILFR